MKKINEFLENKNEFDRLDTKLYFETAHLSNINDIKVTNSFIEMLNKGEKIVPFIVNKMLIDESIIFNSYLILFKEITGLYILLKQEDEKSIKLIKQRISEWWDDNKSKYGK